MLGRLKVVRSLWLQRWPKRARVKGGCVFPIRSLEAVGEALVVLMCIKMLRKGEKEKVKEKEKTKERERIRDQRAVENPLRV